MGSRPRELPLDCLKEKSEDGFLVHETRRKKCSEEETGIQFEDIEHIVIIKSEYLKDKNGTPLTSIHEYKVCDHIVFVKEGREYVLLFELCKSSSKKHDEIIQQLTHGGEQSLLLLSACSYSPNKCNFGFFYVYSKIGTHFIRMLRDKKVTFQGKNLPIHLLQSRNQGFFVTNPEHLEKTIIPRKKR